MLKAVILVGGPLKGTRFRPLTLDIPKPLFPVAGLPIIQHHIEACVVVPNLKEILLIGYYPGSEFSAFINDMMQEYKINIRYLQEFTPLGTAGGMYHFRDLIRSGNPEAFLVLNSDVCADFPLQEMIAEHQTHNRALGTLMVTEATRQQSLHYGCAVQHKDSKEVTHYVEKPSTFISTLINCGVYIFSIEVFHTLAAVFDRKQADLYNDQNNGNGSLSTVVLNIEMDILSPLAGTGRLFAYQTNNWWSQLKTAGSAIYANRHYLALYRKSHPHRLAENKHDRCQIIGDVHIDATAQVHPSAVLGPNASIGKDAVIGPGVRIRESIVMSSASIQDHSLVLHSIVGCNTQIGRWTRVEGTPCDPNPNKPFAKMESPPLFNNEGRLNPSITILGCSVKVSSEVVLLNSIVLPNKDLSRSFKNEIIL